VGKAGGLFFPNPLDPTNGTTVIGSTDPTNPGFSPIIRRDGPCIAPADWQNVSVTYFNGRETVSEVMSADLNWTREFCLEDAEAVQQATIIAASDDFEEAGTRSAVSPRIGVSFPVTANSSFFFNFGRYTQNPLLNNVYVNTGIGKDTTVTFIDESGAEVTRTSSLEGTPTGVTVLVPGEGNPGIIGNPRLVTEKTTLFELGYLAELWDDYAVGITLFTKDQTGLQGIRQGGTFEGIQVFDAGVTYRSSTPDYQIVINNDFQTVRGFEISLRRRIVDFWGFDINYSFSRTFSNAAPPEKEFENQVENSDPALRLEVASEIDQPQRLSATAFFRMGNESPSGFGWLKNSSLSLVGQYLSGFPYTPTTNILGAGTAQLVRNSRRGPATTTINFRAAKGAWWGNVFYDFYLQVNNLLDVKNCQNVFPTTGECTVGTIDQGTRREGNTLTADGITSTYVNHPEYFGPRRSILGGIRVSF
jgi:outer membrane receptor protein involved in Fe transport